MSTLRLIELTCPICATSFESVAPTYSASEVPIFSPASAVDELAALPFFVHVCRRCGYTGGIPDFANDVEVTEALRQCVWSQLAPKLGAAVRLPWMALTLPGSEKYEAAARVAYWRGLDAPIVADLWMRAAWCCQEENDHEAERYYALQAAWCLSDAMNFFEGIAEEERAEVAYRVGELWRWVGDQKRASAWFEQVATEAINPESQLFVRAAELRLLEARSNERT